MANWKDPGDDHMLGDGERITQILGNAIDVVGGNVAY